MRMATWVARAWVLWMSVAAARGIEGAERPNVIVMLADDAGWGDYSLHGNSNLRTPHLDQLARQGAAFERFFVCAVCAPTRAEFLTGRYHPRGGVRGVSAGQERLNLDERTVVQAFHEAGYATGAFGKWHNGSQWPYHPLARGFDEYYGFTSGHWGEYFEPPLEHNGRLVRGKGYVADDFTDRAIAFIEQHQGRPFFCYLAFNTPHSPWAVPEEYWQRFRDRPIALRGTDGEREEIDSTRCALAMMENLDANAGRVMQRIEQLGLADNTIVVYFSDNGPNTRRFNGGMKGIKGTTDEGGLRSPLFIRWPGHIGPGTIVREIAGAIDLAPTLAGLSGVMLTATKPLDGHSLAPLLTAPSAGPWPDRLLVSSYGPNISVRSQRYRLDARGALFDMQSDPQQRTDVAAEQPAEAARLRQAAAAYRREVLGMTSPVKPAADGQSPVAGVLPPDDRPYPVGFAQFPWTPLPARDGVPQGGIRRSAPAPNCSYFVNWRSTDDRITWDIEVQTGGKYDVTIYYHCPPADAGATIELAWNGQRLEGQVTPGFESPLYENQDTLPRPPAESRMKEFRPLKLGMIQLPRGRGPLTLRALRIPGHSVMDVRLIALTLRTE